MKYLVLLIGTGEEPRWDTLTPDQMSATMQRFADFAAICAQCEGVEILAGEALDEAAHTMIRYQGGRQFVTDGPYAEVIEGLGGFYLVESPDFDTLREVIKALPAYDIQVTPVVDIDV